MCSYSLSIYINQFFFFSVDTLIFFHTNISYNLIESNFNIIKLYGLTICSY